ncbi:mucin-6-like [Acipenser ruthenus]|uniref:mucin-6-like n=1 Tax=Acipenser ruthenus TaxID=7906 RepID=UPI00274054DA|nr:mucin-6-like [Acipenser ruthenus]
MKESPETLITDCSLAGGKRTKTNLLFYTQHPTAWHTALCTAHSNIKLGGICKGRQLRIGDETDPDSTRLSINVFYNGTIMIQGTEASLELFEKDFQALKELAEKEKKNPEVLDPEQQPAPHTADTAPCSPHTADTAPCSSPTAAPRTPPLTPRLPSTVQHLKECLSLLEVEFAEFKELTLTTLTENDLVQQIRDEVRQVRNEARASIRELGAEMGELRQDNEALRNELAKLREELQRKERSIQSLREQLLRVTPPPPHPEQQHHSQPKNTGAPASRACLTDTDTDTHTTSSHTHTDPNTHPTPPAHPDSETLPPTTHTTPHSPTTHTTPHSPTTHTDPNTHPTPPAHPDSETLPPPTTHTTPHSPTTHTAPPSHITHTAPETQTPSSRQANKIYSSKVAILIDSNGKYLNQRRLFPSSRVAKFWCPTTERALQLLCQSTLRDPEHIIIHTGTNDLGSQGEDVAESVRRVAEKATKEFPGAKIVISTLLPREDVPQHTIQRINSDISRGCALLPNVHLAHHPTLSTLHLYDHVHLDQEGVRIFAKNLKDTAMGRDPASHPRNRSTPDHHQGQRSPVLTRRPPQEHQPLQPGHWQHTLQQSRRAQPRGTQPSRAQPRGTQPNRAQPRGIQEQQQLQHSSQTEQQQHSYAAAASKPRTLVSSEMGEIRQLLNLIFKIMS